MKKTFVLRLLAALPILMLVVSSCSKDAIPKPEEKQAINNQSAGKGIFDNGTTGQPGTAGLDATVLPERASAAARLFGPDYISNEVVADENGYLMFDGLAEGTYTLWVYGRTPGFISQRITDIFVQDGQVTNLGTITLELDNSVDY